MKFYILSLIIILHGISTADLPEDPAEYSQWQATALSNIRKLREDPSPENIAHIGSLLAALDLPYNREKGDRPVFREARSTLLATPGHAEYFGKKITDAHQEYKNDPRSYKHGGGSKYWREIHDNSPILELLPSPETVKVFGEMLSDEWFDETDTERHRPPALATLAASRLKILPLRDKPYPPRTPTAESLPYWQKWYQQVKEGSRTFSFEGDPNEYNLQGPVGIAKAPDIPPAENPLPVSKQEPQPAVTDSSEPHSRTPWIIAAIAALSTTIGWFFLKKKPAN